MSCLFLRVISVFTKHLAVFLVLLGICHWPEVPKFYEVGVGIGIKFLVV